MLQFCHQINLCPLLTSLNWIGLIKVLRHEKAILKKVPPPLLLQYVLPTLTPSSTPKTTVFYILLHLFFANNLAKMMKALFLPLSSIYITFHPNSPNLPLESFHCELHETRFPKRTGLYPPKKLTRYWKECDR